MAFKKDFLDHKNARAE